MQFSCYHGNTENIWLSVIILMQFMRVAAEHKYQLGKSWLKTNKECDFFLESENWIKSRVFSILAPKASSFLFIDSYSKRMSQKCYQFFINEKLKNWLIFSPVFYPIMCLMKSPKNFEKIAILKIWQLVSFWGVKTHFGE